MTSSVAFSRITFPIFQSDYAFTKPDSAKKLEFYQCAVPVAQSLVRMWHSVLPNTLLSNIVRNKRHIAYSGEFDGLFYCAAIWTSPVAANRLKDGDKLLELRRLAIADDAPRNTASRMISWMCKDIRKRFPEIVKVISYQDTSVHIGTIYKASGWSVIDTNGSLVDWAVNGRKRNRPQTLGRKVRWERQIR